MNKKQKSYEAYLAEYKERKLAKSASFENHLAPLGAKPKLKGRGYTHTYIERAHLDVVSTVKRVIRAADKYQPNRYYACERCGRYVSKKIRREQKSKLIPGKGYENLMCRVHSGKVL